ncbi:MAG: radical SAM protein [Betaproteobacteria bacterium]|nr:radical SAM protein [Betaproteobacteria bacterium]
MNAPTPKLVSWNLTRRCNLACGHCYLDAVQRKSEAPGELTSAEALDAVSQIATAAPGAMLVLTGGEPLLRKDLLSLVQEASGKGLIPVVGTNGVLLDEERARHLKAVGAAGVGISLDSAAPEFHDRLRGKAGAWAAAFEAMRTARAAGLAVQMQTTLFAENRDELAALANIAQEIDALALNFFFLVCTGRGVTQTDMPQAMYEETLSAIVALQRQRPRPMIRARCAPYVRRLLALRAGESRDGYEGWSGACLAGRSYLRITPQGRVTPCPYIPEVVGDLRAGLLTEIWQASAILRRLRSELPGGKCGDCDFRYSCGGCRARAAAASGNLLGEDPKCSYVKPSDARPEIAPRQDREDSGIAWEPAAQAILNRIPSFVREWVRVRLEKNARTAGLAVVTSEFLRANYPARLAGLRPAGTTRATAILER